MKKGISIIACILAFLLNGMVIQANENSVITDVELPNNYTELYANLNIESPVFYETIDCKIDGVDGTVSGVTWTSADYDADVVGTYTFSAVAPSGYQFAEIPTITARVRTADGDTTNKGATDRAGHLYSRDTSDSEVITGFYGMAKAGTSNATRVYDITGFNIIRSTDTSANIRLAGGVDYVTSTVGAKYAANPTELTAKIGLDGANLKSLYGGSYGNIFKGTTDIYVTDGTLTDGVYAGSVNGDFEGTTNIYLSGNSTVAKLYLGSTYSKDAKVSGSGAIVGKQDVSYKGTVNVYIADDFTGTIGAMEVATGVNDDVTANIYLSSKAEVELPVIVGGSKINLFDDNVAVSKTVTSIPYEGEILKNIPLNTAKDALGLAGTLEVHCNDVTYIENGIEWECIEGYSPNTEGYYTFTPILPESYVVSDTSVLPTVTILVKDGVDTIEAVSLPADYTELYTKLNITSPVFYDTLTCKVNGVDTTVLGFTWDSADYKADTVGTYTFTANAPLGYQFAEGVTPTITVRVREAEEDTKNYGAIDRFGHFFSNDKSDAEVITGFYGIAIPGINDSSITRVVDFTGFNPIRSADTSNNIRLVGGVDYAANTLLPEGTVIGNRYAENPTELTAKIGLNGAKMHSMYGGSYGNMFKGTTNIYVTGGSMNADKNLQQHKGYYKQTSPFYMGRLERR